MCHFSAHGLACGCGVMDLSSGEAQAPKGGEAATILVVGDDPLADELPGALRAHGVEAATARTAEGVLAVVHEAPDLVVLVGSARCGGAGQLLAPLTGHPSSAVVPVVLLSDTTELPALDAKGNRFTQGVVGRVQRDWGVEAIAEEIVTILRDLPERPSEAHGVVAEATLDELVTLLSRELQSGVLSVQGEREAQIMLRAGQPIGDTFHGFAERVRPMLEGPAGAQYRFVSHPATRLDSIAPQRPTNKASPTSLVDARLLLAHERTHTMEAWACALRRAGAHVLCLCRRADLRMAQAFDPQIVIVEASALSRDKGGLYTAVRRDERLRWAATLVLPEEAVKYPQRDSLYLGAIAAKVEELTAPHREFAAQAALNKPFETRLELLGPGQLLHSLCATKRSFALRVRHPHAHIDLMLSGGRVLEASALRLDRGTEPLEAGDALALLFALKTGRVSVRPGSGFVRSAPKQSLSLAPSALRLATPLPSAPPEPLVSEIPPPPRLPTGAGSSRRRSEVRAIAREEDGALGIALTLAAFALAGLITYLIWT